jgi:hypothetical protein
VFIPDTDSSDGTGREKSGSIGSATPSSAPYLMKRHSSPQHRPSSSSTVDGFKASTSTRDSLSSRGEKPSISFSSTGDDEATTDDGMSDASRSPTASVADSHGVYSPTESVGQDLRSMFAKGRRRLASSILLAPLEDIITSSSESKYSMVPIINAAGNVAVAGLSIGESVSCQDPT